MASIPLLNQAGTLVVSSLNQAEPVGTSSLACVVVHSSLQTMNQAGTSGTAPIPMGSPAQAPVGVSWVSILQGFNPTPNPAATPRVSTIVTLNTAKVAETGTPTPTPTPFLTRKIANVRKEDVEEEIRFWSKAVVCYVTSANPPFHVIEGFVRCIWKDQEIDKIGMVNRGVFLLRFVLKEHQEQACSMNGILFDKKLFIVKPW